MTKIKSWARGDGFAPSLLTTLPTALKTGGGDGGGWAFARARHHLALAGYGGSDLGDASPFLGEGLCSFSKLGRSPAPQSYRIPTGFDFPFAAPEGGGAIFRNAPRTTGACPTQLAKHHAEENNLRYSGKKLFNGFLNWFQSRRTFQFAESCPRPRSRDPSTIQPPRPHWP
jgi:hypothetical protein